jgi:hypothetical protein
MDAPLMAGSSFSSPFAQQLVDKIVNAVLYEGYILYPYRARSKKNRRRFSFGRVYPRAYSAAQDGADPCMMQTECLVAGHAETSAIQVKVRFLHPLSREVGKFAKPLPGTSVETEIPPCELVPELRAGGKLHQSWQEVTERDVDTGLLPIVQLVEAPFEMLFSFPPSRTRELIRDDEGCIAGVLLRKQEAVEGTVEITATPVDSQAFKIAARIFNHTSMVEGHRGNHDAVLMRTFTSTHTILHVEGGEFISLMDPPAAYAQTAACCKNTGTWPVLVGDEKKGERDTLLSSPVILYDYTQIAPESPGDLHDGTGADEEKLEMHGAMRDAQASREDFFNPGTKLKQVNVAGVDLKAGDRVRIHPKGRAGAMDIALRGKVAVIDAIEEDAEGRAHFALVLGDGPGKDLGMLQQPGHRFFYRADELEPVEAAKS